MFYYRLVISKAFAETRAVWNAHRIWIYWASPLAGILARVLLRGARQAMTWHDLLLFAVLGFIVAWAGTFLINLVRIPPIIHSEVTQENTKLRVLAYPPVSARELEIRARVTEILKACNFSRETKIALRRALDFEGEIRPSTLGTSPMGSRVIAEIFERGVGSGLISKDVDGVRRIRANLQSALRLILDEELSH